MKYLNIGPGTFPDACWQGTRVVIAVQRGDDHSPGGPSVECVSYSDALTDRVSHVLPLRHGSQAYPRLRRRAGLLAPGLAFRNGGGSGAVVELHPNGITAGGLVLPHSIGSAGTDPITMQGKFVAWQDARLDVYRCHRKGIGNIKRVRQGAPTGLSRVLPDGSVTLVDDEMFVREDFSLVGGLSARVWGINPWIMGDAIVAVDPRPGREGLRVRWADRPGEELILDAGLVSHNPRGAKGPGGRYLITAWNGPGVRVWIVSRADLA